jgi:TolA-binding protein
MDGLEHLQSKVDSLVALNNFLKEQVDQKEKMIRELEDRLRRQADEMRNAQSEVEQQSRRLKKRELLISQALKKLETINSLQLSAGPELTSGLGALANELNAHSYDYKSINPHDVITPVRPSTKSTNYGAYPSIPDMGSSYVGGQKRKEPSSTTNKENDYLYKNLEY